mgnify:CR=1 FL=1
MELFDAITTRRSVRKYTDHPVSQEQVKDLLYYATQAPSAMNSQPWSFAIIQNSQLLQSLSSRAKQLLLGMFDQYPGLVRYRTLLGNPDFNIFYGASTLITIYAKPATINRHLDCSLAAQNIMLAAHGMGLGTCWIGFATPLLNQPEVKEELGISATLEAVAPLVVGYPEGGLAVLTKNPPEAVWIDQIKGL